MERLEYKKYKGLENIITIDLHNGYTIAAIRAFDKETQEYIVDLFLNDNQIDNWKPINSYQNIRIKSIRNRINSAILKQVATSFEQGYFDDDIQKYEYETRCFDIGNTELERERLCDN